MMTKRQARYQLNYAVKTGRVIRPAFCVCGNSPVEGHHPDYDKPLDVVWLCKQCHSKAHPEILTPEHQRKAGAVQGRRNVESGLLRRINIESGHWASLHTPEICRAGGLSCACLRWNIRRGKPCTCGRHKE